MLRIVSSRHLLLCFLHDMEQAGRHTGSKLGHYVLAEVVGRGDCGQAPPKDPAGPHISFGPARPAASCMCRQAQKWVVRGNAPTQGSAKNGFRKNRAEESLISPFGYTFHRELCGLFNTASLLVAGAALYFPCCLPGGLLARPLRLEYRRLVCINGRPSRQHTMLAVRSDSSTEVSPLQGSGRQ
jgi:hypothetical protein